MKKGLLTTGKLLLGLLLLLIILVVGYIVYLQIQYYRIPDNTQVVVENNQTATIQMGSAYTAQTYNIGFGAYDHAFSFFMDTGVMADGTKVRGIYGKAIDEEHAQTNTDGVVTTAKALDTDFMLLQEVDTDSHRNYFIDQYAIFKDNFANYGSAYTLNFHSAYLFYPFSQPHGIVNAGLLTMSQYNISDAVRRSYPINESFPAKFFELDRCFAVHYLPVEGGKQLVLINSHMSAYDAGGTSREAQMELLNSVLTEEYKKGNWVIVGGDFNNALFGTIDTFPSGQQTPTWLGPIDNDDFADGFTIVEPANAKEVPTERASDMEYIKGVTHTVVIDGFVVSDNVEATTENIDTNFEYSDHNPVKLTFTLKKQ